MLNIVNYHCMLNEQNTVLTHTQRDQRNMCSFFSKLSFIKGYILKDNFIHTYANVIARKLREPPLYRGKVVYK